MSKLVGLLDIIPQKIYSFLKTKKGKKFLIVFSFFLLFYFIFLSAPFSFPVGTMVSIEKGLVLQEISPLLTEKKVIRSKLFFETTLRLFRADGDIVSGDYFFKKRKNVFGVIFTVVKGKYGLDPIRTTLPEGASTSEMGQILEKQFPDFDKEVFLELASRDEGYLFPDTYLFLPNVKAPQVYREMRDTFDEKIKYLEEEIENSGRTLHEIVTMASILEEEARKTQTRKTIAGILWERLRIGMPLQVDAVFIYILGKNTFDLSLEDLKTDSPYNTYKYKGLPPGPITNPGLDSIETALRPIESDYLFYLSDLDGVTHYSVTFEQHKAKKNRYLR